MTNMSDVRCPMSAKLVTLYVRTSSLGTKYIANTGGTDTGRSS